MVCVKQLALLRLVPFTLLAGKALTGEALTGMAVGTLGTLWTLYTPLEIAHTLDTFLFFI